MYPAFLEQLQPLELVFLFVFMACGSGAGWILWTDPEEKLSSRSRRRFRMLCAGGLLAFAILLALVAFRVAAVC